MLINMQMFQWINIMYVFFQNKGAGMIVSECHRSTLVLFNGIANFKTCHFRSQAQSTSSAEYVDSYRHKLFFYLYKFPNRNSFNGSKYSASKSQCIVLSYFLFRSFINSFSSFVGPNSASRYP